jgi:hypothetical protein
MSRGTWGTAVIVGGLQRLLLQRLEIVGVGGEADDLPEHGIARAKLGAIPYPLFDDQSLVCWLRSSRFVCLERGIECSAGTPESGAISPKALVQTGVDFATSRQNLSVMLSMSRVARFSRLGAGLLFMAAVAMPAHAGFIVLNVGGISDPTSIQGTDDAFRTTLGPAPGDQLGWAAAQRLPRRAARP